MDPRYLACRGGAHDDTVPLPAYTPSADDDTIPIPPVVVPFRPEPDPPDSEPLPAAASTTPRIHTALARTAGHHNWATGAVASVTIGLAGMAILAAVTRDEPPMGKFAFPTLPPAASAPPTPHFAPPPPIGKPWTRIPRTGTTNIVAERPAAGGDPVVDTLTPTPALAPVRRHAAHRRRRAPLPLAPATPATPGVTVLSAPAPDVPAASTPPAPTATPPEVLPAPTPPKQPPSPDTASPPESPTPGGEPVPDPLITILEPVVTLPPDPVGQPAAPSE